MAHAGHSQQLPLLKALLFRKEAQDCSQNNSSLIVQAPTETKAAMVAGWTLPSNTSQIMVLPARLNILTKLETKLASQCLTSHYQP